MVELLSQRVRLDAVRGRSGGQQRAKGRQRLSGRQHPRPAHPPRRAHRQATRLPPETRPYPRVAPEDHAQQRGRRTARLEAGRSLRRRDLRQAIAASSSSCIGPVAQPVKKRCSASNIGATSALSLLVLGLASYGWSTCPANRSVCACGCGGRYHRPGWTRILGDQQHLLGCVAARCAEKDEAVDVAHFSFVRVYAWVGPCAHE